jgi:hypothetical protein
VTDNGRRRNVVKETVRQHSWSLKTKIASVCGVDTVEVVLLLGLIVFGITKSMDKTPKSVTHAYTTTTSDLKADIPKKAPKG